MLKSANVELTYSGGGALFQLCHSPHLQNRTHILLPAFSCPSVIDPVIEAGFRPRFFAIKDDLSIDLQDLHSKLDKDVAAVLVINYFGFAAKIDDLKVSCEDAGAILIEDCAHSFLNANPLEISGKRGDAAIFSFKKLLPSSVGGGIRINRPTISVQVPESDPPISDSIVRCKRLFEQAVENMPDTRVRRAYFALESMRLKLKRKIPGSHIEVNNDEAKRQFEYPFELNLALASMPRYATYILRRANIAEVVEDRRRHFQELLYAFTDSDHIAPVFQKLPDSVCPWAFPAIVKNRSAIDLKSKQSGVPIFSFGETMHAAINKYAGNERRLIDAARFLSNSVLVIAVRQGLPHSEFQHYGDIVTSHAEASVRARPGASLGQ